MDQPLSEWLAPLPVTQRVAFVFDLAAAVLVDLRNQPEACTIAEVVVAKAKAWLAGDEMPAREVYDLIAPLVEMESMAAEEHASHALCVLGSALYYFAWQLYRIELAAGEQRSLPVPGDMAEVDEDAIDEVAELAAASGHFDQAAILRLAQRYREAAV